MVVTDGWRYWHAYKTFHQAEIDTGDVDPVYPVLKEVARLREWSAEETVRAVFLHVAYYDLGSALLAMDYWPRRLTELPCGTERRGHRTPARLAKHLDALDAWMADHSAGDYVTDSPVESFNALVAAVGQIPGNGRWASYKTAEMLWKVAGLELDADRLEIEGSSGPAAGLMLLAPDVRPTELLAKLLISDLSASLAAPVRPEQVETTLCDFHALFTGRYYVGHDIDQMLAQLVRADQSLSVRAGLAARASVLPWAYLGEHHGWLGPDAQRRRVFYDTGRIVTR
jgi:hypothetical protein